MHPERAVAIASVNAIRHFGLKVDPEAHFVVRDLVNFEIVRVVPPHRSPCTVEHSLDLPLRSSVHLPSLANFIFPAWHTGCGRKLAIGVNDTELVTDKVFISQQDNFSHLAVLERHGINGNVAYALIVGVGRIHGAIAPTTGHDSHNVTVMGDNDTDMRAAVAHLGEIGGGATVFQRGRSLADFHLPIGGLMGDGDVASVAAEDAACKDAAHAIGCMLPSPLTTMSFMSLPVIPHLKLTDCGLFDVDNWRFVAQ